MNNKNPMEIRSKITSLMRIRGPCLPVHISRETGLEMLFASAFLAELSADKTVKISNLKVGSSPLYFLPGQESLLENFSNFLPGKEKEAFLLLKEKKVLEDTKQEPAIRVALRSIKDFAYPFIISSQEGQKLFWRFHSTAEEARKLIEPVKVETKIPIIKPEIKQIIKTEIKPEIKPGLKTEQTKLKTPKITVKKEKPLLEIKEPVKREKEKSEFAKDIISFLEKENIELIEEKEFKKKEFSAIARINSDIGKLQFLVIAKDKKAVTENDLTLALQKAQTLKMPSLFLSTGQPNKKALGYLQTYTGLIRFRKID